MGFAANFPRNEPSTPPLGSVDNGGVTVGNVHFRGGDFPMIKSMLGFMTLAGLNFACSSINSNANLPSDGGTGADASEKVKDETP